MPPNDSTDVLMRLVRIETQLASYNEAKIAEHADLWEAIRMDKKELGDTMKELATKVDGLERARDQLMGVRYALYAVFAGMLMLAGLVVHMQTIISRIR